MGEIYKYLKYHRIPDTISGMFVHEGIYTSSSHRIPNMISGMFLNQGILKGLGASGPEREAGII